MKITELGPERIDWTRNYTIGGDTISYRALLGCIRRIPGAVITKTRRHWFIGVCEIVAEYKDITITFLTSSTEINIICSSSGAASEEFISKLRSYNIEITQWKPYNDGTRKFMMRSDAFPYRALLGCIRRIPETVITNARQNWFTNEFEIVVEYKDITITFETVWADTIVTCSSSGEACDEFISKLRSHKLAWWEHIIRH